MVTPQAMSTTRHSWRVGFSHPEHLEAPNSNFTGHRDILTRSMARYRFAGQRAHGDILDVGCGRGYGFSWLGDTQVTRIGLDLSHAFLCDAHKNIADVGFVNASGEAIPFASSSFDTVISFEVIEHLEDDHAYLNELKRLARPDATIIISTPNRLISSGNAAKPLNPFHSREYLADEFRALLAESFATVELWGQTERESEQSTTSSLIDRIPINWKYRLPAYVQDVFSVMLRPALQLDDCWFRQDEFDKAHTLFAVCHP